MSDRAASPRSAFGSLPGAAEIESFVTLGLGDSSYLVGSGDEAALIDPQRDAWRFVEVAEQRGWRIRYVLETHVHNDYVSGALEARAAHGAEVVVPARGGPYGFPHRPADAADELRVGDLRFVARATPGHTYEHLAWELRPVGRPDGERDRDPGPEAVFSGGSLLAGSAGRTDLLGSRHAEELARLQFRTVHWFATLPPTARLLPTHGAGSFCVTNRPSGDRVSTIGRELAESQVLAVEDEDAFVRQQLGMHARYPTYYGWMAPLNRNGPALLGRPPAPRPLEPAGLAGAVASGAVIVDARDREAFALAHLSGSLNIELGDAFATYVGWTVPHDTSLVLVVPEPAAESAAEAALQLARIGWDRVVGYLAGGIEHWVATGGSVRSFPVARMRDLYERRASDRTPVAILDVRQPSEWREDGVIPGSDRVFVADLRARAGLYRTDVELWVVCTTGQRAAIAASILDAVGVPVRLISRGGTVGWIERFRGTFHGPSEPPAAAASATAG